MRHFYAELNGSSIVKCILDTDREVVLATMVPITSLDSSLLGKRHVGAGIFEDVE